MAAKGKKKDAPDREHDNERLIAQNRKARHEYEVLDTLECGIVLVGSEVKSLRKGTLSLDDAYGRVKDGEVWLIGCDIAEYVQGNRFNHVEVRDRKLLLNRREIAQLYAAATQRNFTIVPLRMYINERGRAKVEIGIARQQPARLQLHQGGGDEQELGGDLEIEVLGLAHLLQLDEVGIDDPRQRDLVQIHLLADDQVQQEVERSLEPGGLHLVGHGHTLVTPVWFVQRCERTAGQRGVRS